MKIKKYDKKLKSVDEYLILNKIEDLENFKNPSFINSVNSPFNLDFMKEGIELLSQAIKNNQNILIIIDSDTDGFCSAAIMYRFIVDDLRYSKVEYILHKNKQHGIEDHFDFLLDYEPSLIIIPDAGSNDTEFFQQLKHHNFLILDHHEVEHKNFCANNWIIINNQSSQNYTNKAASGAVVTWQFIRGYAEVCETIDLHEIANGRKYIDLTAVALISDVMDCRPIENRWFIEQGLQNLQNQFIIELKKKQAYSIGDKLTQIGVSWYFGPLINALIRVGDQKDKEMMFLSMIKDNEFTQSNKRGAKGETVLLAEEICRIAGNLRNKQNKIIDEYLNQVCYDIESQRLHKNKIIVFELDNDYNYPSEINGLTVMKVVSKYGIPATFIRKMSDGTLRGSMRAPSGFDLKSVLQELGVEVIGHAGAAGTIFLEDQIEKVINYFNKEYANHDFTEKFYNIYYWFDQYDLYELRELVFELDKFKSLWGQQLEEPYIYIEDLPFSSFDIKIMGNDQSSLKIEKGPVNFIKFKDVDLIEKIQKQGEGLISIVGRTNVNDYMGNKSAQIFVEDYEIKKDILKEF